MTTEEAVKHIAYQCDGTTYRNEPVFDKELAVEHNIVVAYGASDDLLELCGAVDDEIGAFNGCKIYLSQKLNVKRMSKHGARVEVHAKWNDTASDGDPCWVIETDSPCQADFMIYEDGEPFCRGVVFVAKKATL